MNSQHVRLLCPWDFPGKNTRVGCHFLIQGISLAQGLNPHLLHWQVETLPLSLLRRPKMFPSTMINSISINGKKLSQLRKQSPWPAVTLQPGSCLCLPLFAAHWLNEDTLILGGSFVRYALSFTTVRKSRNACPVYTRHTTTMSIQLRVHTAVGFPSESGQRGWKVTGRKYALQGPVAAGSASANKRPASRHHRPTSQTPDWSPRRSSCLLPEAAQPGLFLSCRLSRCTTRGLPSPRGARTGAGRRASPHSFSVGPSPVSARPAQLAL